ncbi:MAG: GHKL domain-containing protein [Myxococcales bacterium]|nr:GHKL domain-containing protein [Myxococcales bacterium]
MAEATERGWIHRRVAKHPLVFSLSLGVYATSWTFFGSLGLAERLGYGYLTIYLGVTLACLAIPVIWRPLARVVHTQQLSSLADLMAYRFHSSTAGALVALLMLVSSLPYLALQLRAVGESAHILVPELSPSWVSLFFGGIIATFAVLFGVRHVNPRHTQHGLAVSMAFESLIKLIALTMAGAYAWIYHLGGFRGVKDWLEHHPEALARLVQPTHGDAWITLIILSFGAAFLLPRQFHLAFVKPVSKTAFAHTMWVLPAYLLSLSLPIPILYWSAAKQGSSISNNPDFIMVQLVSEQPILAFLIFLGGISASSGMMIVCSIALANMTMNHLVLPVWRPLKNFYRSVIWLRRSLVVLIIFGGYLMYITLNNGALADWGLLTFVAVCQLLPGVLSVLFWPKANRWGFIGGLSAGSLCWVVLLIFPALGIEPIAETVGGLAQMTYPDRDNHWSIATGASLLSNISLFVIGSLLFSTRREEMEAAEACAAQGLPSLRTWSQRTAEQLIEDLQTTLGREVAQQEVNRARIRLGLPTGERRLRQLGQLEHELTSNLSGLVGPTVARQALGPRTTADSVALVDHILLVQEHLHNQAPPPSAAQMIDLVRRYFGDVLEQLPVGICAFGSAHEILIWNQVMARLSHLERHDYLGQTLSDLPSPWPSLFSPKAPATHTSEVQVQDRVLTLRIGSTSLGNGGWVYLVEDLTEQSMLQTKIAHEDRLRSIGRLAASVAHDIGNPLAGILLVARNLMDETNPEDAQERLRLIVSEASRIKKIVESLSTFSHRGRGFLHLPRHSYQEVSVNDILQDALQLIRLTHKDIPCSAQCEPNLRVLGDSQQLTQVLVNLLTNACDASAPGSNVTLSAHKNNTHIQITIADSGEGIEDDAKAHIFEPFYTTKDIGLGTGLGLTIVHHIIEHHGGSIHVDSQRGEGSRFIVRLRSCHPKNRLG